jgi:MoaA/NifB/PqqE/SkfB family radical SAM enzyme
MTLSSKIPALAQRATSMSLLVPDSIMCLKHSSTSSYCLRHDVRRSLLYETNSEGHTVIRATLIHPTQAILLALFDGRRTLGAVMALGAQIFACTEGEICQAISSLLDSIPDLLMEQNGKADISYEPLAFLVPAHEIDMHSTRLYHPLSLVLRVTETCTRRCRYCYVQNREIPRSKQLPLGRLRELFDECSALNVAEVVLGGGDPLVRSDIVELIGAMIARGIMPFISTKAHVSKDLARNLAGVGLDWIQVSVDSFDPATVDYLTNSRGALAEITDSINNLRNSGISIRANCLLTRVNIHTVPALMRELDTLGVNRVILSKIGLSMYSKESGGLLPRQADLDWLRERLLRSESSVTLPIDDSSFENDGASGNKLAAFRRRAHCTGGRTSLVAHSDGKVTLCEELPITPDLTVGDLSSNSLLEVWNSPRIAELLHPLRESFAGTVCATCAEFEECHNGPGRCFRDALKAYGSFYSPSPNCPKAPPACRLS